MYCYLSAYMDVSAHHDCRRQQQSGVSNDDADSSSDGISPTGVCSSPLSTSLLKRKHLMSRAGAGLEAEVCVFFAICAHVYFRP